MTPAIPLALAAAFLSMAVVFVSKTFADAIFLGEFGVVFLPHLFVAQAVGLVAASAGYGALIQRRAAAPIDGAILVCFAATALCGVPAMRAGGASVFAVSLALVVLATLSNLAVWNAATAVVSGRRSRWLLPRAGAASTAGAVVGSFSSSAVVGGIGVEALSPAIGALALAALVCRGLLVKRSGEWRIGRPDRSAAREVARRSDDPDAETAGNPRARLVRLLAAATIVEACLTAFIDFGFKREVAGAFREPDDIGLFFALFYGVSNAALLAMQLLLGSRLLSIRSLRFSLTLQPAALLGAVVAWALFPVLAIAILARGLDSVLKFGVARPAQEVALTPISEVARKRWKVLLRGVYNQGGGAMAGMLLVAAGPLVGWHPAVVPAAAAVSALAWLVLQKLASDRYLDALGATLGLRRLSLRDQRGGVAIDREGMGQIVALAGVDDAEVARFGRELLASAAGDSRVLAPYVGQGPPAQREALYRLLASRPHRSCVAALRTAMAEEDPAEPSAASCLDALAAHGDLSQIDRARALVAERPPDPDDPIGWAAWSYLARAGALDQDRAALDRVLGVTLARDGARAAEILRALAGRALLSAEEIETLVERAARDRDPSRRVQGLTACAVLGWPRLLPLLIEAMAGREPGLDGVIGRVDATALAALFALDEYRNAAVRVRARFLRAVRASDLPDLAELAARELCDPDPHVRELAARTVLRRQRDHGEALPRDLAERALALQLDCFARYVRARPGYASTARESQMEVQYRSGASAELTAEAFFLDELERRTERSLSRLCAVLALFGNPSSVYAAERALRAHAFKRRRQALDILQEVARGRDRARLLELLEAYLLPPRAVPPDARAAVCEMDPWLARCSARGTDRSMARLWALRGTLLFDDVDGELLEALAVRAGEVEVVPGEVVVAEGTPGDALFVVISGAVAVERDCALVAELGPGQAFGELALLDGLPRQATVRSTRSTRLLRLPRDTFDSALAENPEIGLGLVRGLVRWLRQGDDPRHGTRRPESDTITL